MNLIEKYCRAIVKSEQVDIFKFNARIIINGSSFSGKTVLCRKILKKYFSSINTIAIINSPNSDEFKNDLDISDKVKVYDEVPSISELEDINDNNEHIVIVLDDNYSTSFNSETVLSYFTRGRHKNLSVILLCQNIFFGKGKYCRDITLQATHIIILKLRDISQVQVIARQIYGKGAAHKVLEVYKYIINKYKWSHLLIDVSQMSISDTELRSNIVNDKETYGHIFELCYKIK